MLPQLPRWAWTPDLRQQGTLEIGLAEPARTVPVATGTLPDVKPGRIPLRGDPINPRPNRRRVRLQIVTQEP
jgi:hypothetical protein